MKLILITNTDGQKFINELNEFCSSGFNNIINIAYSTNTIQIIEGKRENRLEIVKTNYSALIQYS